MSDNRIADGGAGMGATAGLTEEQALVVNTWEKGIAVMAGAGSGKTFTLVAKVRALLMRKPDARFAAVSFTEKSASDLRAKLTRLTLEVQGRPLQGHVVTTIHGLCSSIIREYPREAGFDGDETMLSETESASLWLQALDGLFFEELPPEVESAFTMLSERESRGQLYDLLRRVRDLQANGILERLANAPELATLAEFVLERYDRLKRRRGALDFNDLELGADRALVNESVSRDYRKRFDLIMVDEFQDTNPVQARILTHLARPGLKNLCVVGDPKQSIYRFRDADVTVFQDFCSRLPVRAALTKNFRSVPGVLEFCNQVCAPIFTASEMEYQALTPGLEADPAIDPVVSVVIRSPDELAALIRAETARGVSLSDMALLLRTIRGKPEKWLKALTAAGIPIAIESGGLLWNDPRSREIAHFLKWWANPANEVSGIAFLRAPWVGVSENDIDQWRGTDPGMLHSFLRSNSPVARILAPLRLHPGRLRPGELLLKLLQVNEIERQMGIFILALWHRCEALSEEGLDFQRVAERLAEDCEENRRERAVPPPKNAGQLRVMTVHGSKGLEFPHVILLDFPEKTERAKSMPLLYWDRERGPFLAGRDEEGDRLKKDPIEEEWRKLETEKELAESKRVFYVALTRAQKRLILILPTTEDPKKREQIAKHREKITDVSRVDFWRGWTESALKSQKKLTVDSSSAARALAPAANHSGLQRGEPPRFLPRRPRHSVSEWNLLSRCERSYEWTTIRPIAPTEEEEWKDFIALETKRAEMPKKSGPKIAQSEIGTRVHRCLELGDEFGLHELESQLGASAFQAKPVVEWMRNSQWMKEELTAWKELAFETPVSKSPAPTGAATAQGPEVLIGALDRLVRDRDGNFVIIDFKVTGKSKTKAELLEAYQTQLNLYAWALEGLVPESRGKIRALLVHIAGGQIQEIEVPISVSRLDDLQKKSSAIVRGKPGEPQPGSLCAVCEHRVRCEEGTRFFETQN